MKIATSRWLSTPLLLLILLAGAPLAQAYYDPGIQRWFNRDPIGEQGGLNEHSFVENSPNQLVDSAGLQAIPFRGPVRPPADYKWTVGDNCYQYACNRIGPNSDIPGASKNQRCNMNALTCQELARAAKADGLTDVPDDGKCPAGTHKVAYLVGAQGNSPDYHFMREDPEGVWSQKFKLNPPGPVGGPVDTGTVFDFPGTPRQPASRYTVCGFLCAPD